MAQGAGLRGAHLIIPSIDLEGGSAVQLVGGKEKALDAGDPLPLAEQFSLIGEIAVVDLDAALGRGSNADVIRRLPEVAPCRVGGGIRDAKTALDWLDAGATKVVLGTAARPEVLKELPKKRVIAALDALGAKAQVGMALYTGRLFFADAFLAPLRSDRPDGLFPTVVTDARGGVLGLCYSSRESLKVALEERRGVYFSRRRGLWRKGETSGATQELLFVEVDCDRDALCFVVRQQGAGFCHLGKPGCFGEARGLSALERTLAARREEAPPGSYTARLFDDPAPLEAKLLEEAGELARAKGRDEVVWEAADLLYFLSVTLAKSGVSLDEVERELDRRRLRVRRRSGAPKVQDDAEVQA